MYLGDLSMYAVDSALREDVWEWARDSNIQIEYNGTDFNMDIWRVVDPEHYTWFELRWK